MWLYSNFNKAAGFLVIFAPLLQLTPEIGTHVLSQQNIIVPSLGPKGNNQSFKYDHFLSNNIWRPDINKYTIFRTVFGYSSIAQQSRKII